MPEGSEEIRAPSREDAGGAEVWWLQVDPRVRENKQGARGRSTPCPAAKSRVTVATGPRLCAAWVVVSSPWALSPAVRIQDSPGLSAVTLRGACRPRGPFPGTCLEEGLGRHSTPLGAEVTEEPVLGAPRPE